jgi:xyloglucan-specific exo-beta-1,4-glucanase
MNQTTRFVTAGMTMVLLAGCGGSGENGGAVAASDARTAKVAAAVRAAAMPIPVAKWMNVKFGGGGYVPGLIFHPTSPDVLYARTDIGGTYRWNAATSAWIPITDGFGIREEFFNGAESVALDPNDDRRVYMTTGLYANSDRMGRLYISTNRGDDWTHVDLPFPVGSNNQGRAIGERLMVDPNRPSTLFYASRTAGLWKSADYGQSWAQVSSLASRQMTKDEINAIGWSGVMGVESVLFDTSTRGTGTATQVVYTAVAPDYAKAAGLNANLYKSADGGATWTAVATPVAGYHIPHMVRARDGMIYVAFTQGSGPGATGAAALYKFDGGNWTLLKRYDPTQWTSFGIGGLSVSGAGATTRIALGVSNSWGNWQGQPVVQLSDAAGATWREIGSTTPHGPSDVDFSGWVDDVEIDPNNPDHILHVFGGGVWETKNASAATPGWKLAVDGLEETATLGLATPPKGAAYTLLNSSGDIGMHVQTELLKKPTRGPAGWFSNGNSADMAWSTPSYIAAIGIATWNHPGVGGAYSTDSGLTWTAFAGNHPDGLANQGAESNIAVTAPGKLVWAPSNARPAWSMDNGATWTYTNLPALSSIGLNRAYRLAADRRNPNRVYAYDSGGAWWNQWSDTAHFWISTDGGRTFAESAAFLRSGARVADWNHSSVAVNPNAEGDIWVADGHSVLHSVDAGATWTKLDAAAPDWGRNETWMYPEVYGATAIALGKAPSGASYSSSVYVVGVIKGVWGIHRSDDGGATWTRINDDKHQFAGIGPIAADQTVPGRVYIAGAGRGVLFSY